MKIKVTASDSGSGSSRTLSLYILAAAICTFSMLFAANLYAQTAENGISLRGTSDGQTIELNWDAQNSDEASGYRILWSREADPVYPPGPNDYYDTIRDLSGDTYIADYFLNTGTYYIRVCAFDSEENCLYYSNQLELTIDEIDESALPDTETDQEEPAVPLIPLTDIEGHRNRIAIEYLYVYGVISGYPDQTFRPDNTVNRAELIKILVGGQGMDPDIELFNNCFPDVTEEWFAPYVCYAKSSGWVSGYPDGSFKPENTVNKAEAIKMLVNSQGYSLPEEMDSEPYSDVTASDWFATYVYTAKARNLLEEIGSLFNPEAKMTRAGISENIYRAMYIEENSLEEFPPEGI